MTAESVFSHRSTAAYPYRYNAALTVDTLVGGTPSDPKVAEGWLRTKIESSDEIIRQKVIETMEERGLDADEAAKEVSNLRHLNGFKRDEEHGLYIEGRQIKAMLKEGACIRWPDKRWGPTRKGTKSFVAEHVFVPEDRVYLGRRQADDINQRFVHVFRGNGIALDEICHDVKLNFTVVTDYAFTDDEWADLWLTCEQNGVGACRSQGYGRFAVTGWDVAEGGSRRRRRTVAS